MLEMFMYIVAALLLIIGVDAADVPPKITSTAGIFAGSIQKYGPYSVAQYLGIPYAEPPTGQYRFQNPRPKPPMTQEFNATIFGPACPTTDPLKFRGAYTVPFDEDCLSINVYIPATITATPHDLPVMVWIYGGGFVTGTSSIYNPANIVLQGNVIVVTFNYRLGSLGFLSTGDANAVGNYGLWDQHVALKWVKNNIRAFGGDDNKITLFGESAGSASVGFHAISPHSTGLFNKFLMESGSPISPWATNKFPLNSAKILGATMGCNFTAGSKDTQNRRLVQCLRGMSVDSILLHESQEELANYLNGYMTAPVIDGDFVPDDPIVLINNQTYLNQVGFYSYDSLLGCNNNEGSLFFSITLSPSQRKKLQMPVFYKNTLLSSIMDLTYGTHDPIAIDILQHEYHRWQESSDTSVSLSEIAEVYGDLEIALPTINFAIKHIKQTSRTYLYYFDQYPKYDLLKHGIPHAGELAYVFEAFAAFQKFGLIPKNIVIPQEDIDLSHQVIAYWTNFAKSG